MEYRYECMCVRVWFSFPTSLPSFKVKQKQNILIKMGCTFYGVEDLFASVAGILSPTAPHAHERLLFVLIT